MLELYSELLQFLLLTAFYSALTVSMGPFFVAAFFHRRQRALSRSRRYIAIRRQTEESRLRKRRYSVNQIPSEQELLSRWVLSGRSAEDALAFGSLMLDLEAHLRSDLIRKNNRIIGREGGIRRWLALHCPEIGYKTAMRYKSLACKYRQSIGVPEHRPTAWYLPSSSIPVAEMRTALSNYAQRAKGINSWIAAEAKRDAAALNHETDEDVAAKRKEGKAVFEKNPAAEPGIEASGVEGATRRIAERLCLIRDFCGGHPERRSDRKSAAPSLRRRLFSELFDPRREALQENFAADTIARIMVERFFTHRTRRYLDPERGFALPPRKPFSPEPKTFRLRLETQIPTPR